MGLIIVQEMSTTSDATPKNYETLLVDRVDGVVTITFNRPKSKNAVNGAMWIELLEVLTEIQHNGADRVVVLTGAAGDFCSGADLVAMGDGKGRAFAFLLFDARSHWCGDGASPSATADDCQSSWCGGWCGLQYRFRLRSSGGIGDCALLTNLF